MADPTPLQMINDNLKEIKTDVKEIKEDMKNGAVKMENHEQRIRQVEKKGKVTERIIIEHVKNKKKHHMPHYSETFRQRVGRKKGEIAVGASGGGLIGAIIILILKLAEYI